MSQKPETVFKERIMPLLKAIPNSWVEKVQQLSKRGTADIIGCFSGQFVAIELKKDLKELDKKDSTSKLQDYKLEKIRQAGGVALKISPETWAEAYEFLKSIKGVKNVTEVKKTRSKSRLN
jgi:hypothetical protein